jgi:hypothetical protein
VNTTARHESTGEAGKIHCSRVTCEELKKRAPEKFNIVERGLVEMKGKGKQLTYWLSSGECNNLVNESALKQLELEIQDLLAKTNFDIREQTKNAKKSLGLLTKLEDESASCNLWEEKSEQMCPSFPQKKNPRCPYAKGATKMKIPTVQTTTTTSNADQSSIPPHCPFLTNPESPMTEKDVGNNQLPVPNDAGDSTCRCQIM